MNIKKQDVIKIMSFKHNGYIHRVWDNAVVVEADKEKIVVCTRRTKVTESNGRVWYTKEPAILYFYYNEWFNTIAMLKPGGISYYTNISSPCLFDRGVIKYIDYDIDVKTDFKGNYKILDKSEFYCHKYSMQYSKDIENIVMQTVKNVVNLFRSKKEPFNNEFTRNHYKKIKVHMN